MEDLAAKMLHKLGFTQRGIKSHCREVKFSPLLWNRMSEKQKYGQIGKCSEHDSFFLKCLKEEDIQEEIVFFFFFERKTYYLLSYFSQLLFMCKC